MSYPYARFTGRFAVSSRLFVGTCVIVLACVATPAFGDGPPTLVKIRLRGGRAVVGELIEQSPDSLKLRDLKSGKEAAYPHDDLLKVERVLTYRDATASAGHRVFPARKVWH
jgi:hypothetical protein